MNKKTITKAALIAYAVIGIITFGHAASIAEAEADAEYAMCSAVENSVCLESIYPPFSGLFAAALWPLYWSWEAWR